MSLFQQDRTFPPSATPYQPLKDNEIRLVRCTDKTFLQCDLRTTTLNDPDYHCVSYHWADATLEPIHLNDTPWHTTRSAAKVLRGLDGWLWIDAICINQEDEAEKTSQINLMQAIFKQSQGTRAWIEGDGTIDFHIPDLLARSSLPGMRALKVFFSNPYWERVWIVQELVLAKRIIIHYGSVFHMKTTFAELCIACAQGVSYLSKMIVQTRSQRQADQWCSDSELIELKGILETILNAVTAVVEAEDILKGTMPRWLDARQEKATREHDHVYGKLGIMPVKLDPDYSKPYKNVFTEYTFKWLQHLQTLTSLEYAMDPDFPSWVVNLRDAEFKGITSHVVDGWVEMKKLYDATAGSTFSATLRHNSLIIPGLIFDSIVEVASGSATWTFLNASNAVRVVLADSTELLRMTTQAEDLPLRIDPDVAELVRQKVMDQDEDFITALSMRLDDYQVFRTSRGHYGQSRPSAQIGDKILFMAASFVPFCARKVEGGLRLISACYMDGLMDGQVVDYQDGGRTMDELFEPICLL